MLRAVACGISVCTAVAPTFSDLHAEDLVTPPVMKFKDLDQVARDLAAKPYQPQPDIPEELKNLDYDQFRWIGFRDGHEVWGETILPYRIGFYHKGYVHADDVSINTIEEGQVRPIPFSKDYFHYLNAAKDLAIPDDLGFAGFRVKGAFPGQSDLSEIFSFVGASYFRARSANTILGTSTRGLAINCGLPLPEEFPVFREYWIVKPQPGDKALKVFALLDSPSVSGAFEFLLTPGIEKTDIDIHQSLYFRQVPEKIGIAPMSSMWLWGDALPGPQGDHRPEVHDADGLLVQGADGKWLWRALGQQNYPSIIQLKYDGLKGFGLLQRDTHPNHYLDDEARYDARPSVWIQPQSEWGSGKIELLEIPAPHEGIDNIAAWWVPDEQVTPGTPFEVSYRISYFAGDCPEHGLAKAIAHRVQREESGKIQVEVDFDGPALASLDSGMPPTVEVSSIRGEILSKACDKRVSGSWTVRLNVQPTNEGPVELRVSLKDTNRELTETWAYLCPLTPPKVSLPPWKVKDHEVKERAQ
ncbi:glucan biosynthesis protein G [Planctomicrobium sp. SH661]|uniref:glucan biosynthesis protein G n=1 Tax=Planctomicrobium sp. SH661 TaxID=3448124 RepID=UPI003F5C4C29